MIEPTEKLSLETFVDQKQLPAIFSCGMLKPEHVAALQAINAELADNWGKRQVFRTETEMRMSVLDDGHFPTRSSKYWQAVREQAVMLDNLAVVGFDYRRNEVALKRHLKKLAESTDELEREDIQIDIDECLFKKAGMEQNANDRVREIRLWSQIKAELDDGSFDNADVNTHQLVSYYQALVNRRDHLTPGSSQAEVLNVIGPLATTERLLKEAGLV